jgi:hypothetical protein
MSLSTCRPFVTDRQLDEQWELVPVKPRQRDASAAGFDRARAPVRSEN